MHIICIYFKEKRIHMTPRISSNVFFSVSINYYYYFKYRDYKTNPMAFFSCLLRDRDKCMLC